MAYLWPPHPLISAPSPAISGAPSLSRGGPRQKAVSHTEVCLLAAGVDFPQSQEVKLFSRHRRVGPAQGCLRQAGSQPRRARCCSPTALGRERWSDVGMPRLLPGPSIAVSSMQRCRKVRINLQKKE